MARVMKSQSQHRRRVPCSLMVWSLHRSVPHPPLGCSTTSGTAQRSSLEELANILPGPQSVSSTEFVVELVHFPLLASAAKGPFTFRLFAGLVQLPARRVFAGFFLIPPTLTWSRVRHALSSGHPPLPAGSCFPAGQGR